MTTVAVFCIWVLRDYPRSFIPNPLIQISTSYPHLPWQYVSRISSFFSEVGPPGGTQLRVSRPQHLLQHWSSLLPEALYWLGNTWDRVLHYLGHYIDQLTLWINFFVTRELKKISILFGHIIVGPSTRRSYSTVELDQPMTLRWCSKTCDSTAVLTEIYTLVTKLA